MKASDAEDTAQSVILALVAGMAGAGSFTHVHDWTMRNVPPGTGSCSAGLTPSSPNSSRPPPESRSAAAKGSNRPAPSPTR